MSKVVSKFNYNQGVRRLLGLALIFFSTDVLASGMTLGDMADSIVGSFESVTKLITAGSYLAGLGFMVVAIIQFKAHKDNPAQTPIGKPIALVFIGASLLFMPTILDIAGETMFAGSGTTAGPEGTVFTTE
jgi:intracellular multiplication protein IcmD